jgi:hypothetical protein
MAATIVAASAPISARARRSHPARVGSDRSPDGSEVQTIAARLASEAAKNSGTMAISSGRQSRCGPVASTVSTIRATAPHRIEAEIGSRQSRNPSITARAATSSRTTTRKTSRLRSPRPTDSPRTTAAAPATVGTSARVRRAHAATVVATKTRMKGRASAFTLIPTLPDWSRTRCTGR